MDPAGDAWNRPPPRPRPFHGGPEAPSSSSSSSDEDEVGILDQKRAGQGSRQGGEGSVAADSADRVEDAPVVVGKGPGPRKGSGLFTLKGRWYSFRKIFLSSHEDIEYILSVIL